MSSQAQRETINIDQLEEIISDFSKNVGKIEKLKEIFAIARLRYDHLLNEVSKKYTVADLKKRMYSRPGEKKAWYVENYLEGVFRGFWLSNKPLTIHYGSVFSMSAQDYQKIWLDTLAEKVNNQTQEDWKEYVRQKEEKRAFQKKCLTNPETKEEFNWLLSNYKPIILDKIPGAKDRYEAMVAEKTIKKKKEEVERIKDVKSVELSGVAMEIVEGYHAKKNIPLWVVVLSDRVDKETFQELKDKASSFGGYYSRYNKNGAIPGFQFATPEDAESFCGLQDGDVVSKKGEEKAEQKKDNVANRFFEMAERMEEAGKEKLFANRKVNTARRARIAAGVEADAEADIYFAKVIRNIGQALEDRELKFLQFIESRSQLEELDSILASARWKRVRAENVKYLSEEYYRIFEKDIEYIEYPYPSIHKEFLRRIVQPLLSKKGQKMRARRLYNMSFCAGWSVKFKDEYNRSDLKAITRHLEKYDKERVNRQLISFNRIQKMGLTNLATLKMALREFNELSKVDALSPEERTQKDIERIERKFIGKKISGFFPTPAPLGNRLVSLADIEDTDLILEPSAGLGHLADAISNRNPEQQIHVCEIDTEMQDVLELKGYEVVASDFLRYADQCILDYDKIIMNPPFENLADIDHVKAAYKLLAQKGRLVAIMAANKAQNMLGIESKPSRTKVLEFNNWLEEVGAYVEICPDGAFKSAFRPTGVNTIIVAIDKIVS